MTDQEIREMRNYIEGKIYFQDRKLAFIGKLLSCNNIKELKQIVIEEVGNYTSESTLCDLNIFEFGKQDGTEADGLDCLKCDSYSHCKELYNKRDSYLKLKLLLRG